MSQVKSNDEILKNLLKEEANKYCADCGQKGTHISKVKSLTLDKWTDEQIESMRSKGNARINAVYNPNPERFPFPTNPSEIQQYVSDKYERKLFMNSGNQPTSTLTKNDKIFDYHDKASNIHLEENGPSVKELLTQLHQMGFSNTKICMEAVRIKGRNIDDIVEYLIEKEMVHDKMANPSVSRERTLKNDKATIPAEECMPKETEPYSSAVPSQNHFGFEEELNPWAEFSQEDINRKQTVGHNFDSIDPFKRK